MWFKKRKYIKLEELQYLCKNFIKIIDYKEYFKNDIIIIKNDTKIIFNYEKDIYGIGAKIFYKDILIAEMIASEVPFYAYDNIEIFYNPCDKIIDEINQNIDCFINTIKPIIDKDKEQKRLKEQHIKEILGIKD